MRLADSTVFNVFPYELIQGNMEEALVAPGCVVLAESVSKILFGDEDPLGKAINVDGDLKLLLPA